MGTTGPVMYYDMPSRHFGVERRLNSLRKRIYRAMAASHAVRLEYGLARFGLASDCE